MGTNHHPECCPDGLPSLWLDYLILGYKKNQVFHIAFSSLLLIINGFCILNCIYFLSFMDIWLLFIINFYF